MEMKKRGLKLGRVLGVEVKGPFFVCVYVMDGEVLCFVSFNHR